MVRGVAVLMPGHGPGDLPSHLSGDAAASVLAAWTAAWRPEWLAATRAIPRFLAVENLPQVDDLEEFVVLVPTPCDNAETSDWITEVATRPGVRLARGGSCRADFLSALGAESSGALDSDVFALGFTWLQVQRLCERMVGHSLLDTESFASAAEAAARAAVEGDFEQARNDLSRAFELLSQARSQAVSSEWSLIDITLLAESVLGEPLAEELRGGWTRNVLLTGELAERLCSESSEGSRLLRDSVSEGQASIAGGAQSDKGLADLDPESMLAELHGGMATIERCLGTRPAAFASFAGGIPTRLPAALVGLKCERVLLTAFDGTAYPWPDQARTTWVGIDGQELQAVCTPPIDSGSAVAAWRLCDSMADAVAHDWSGTLLFAGWPGARCESFSDLRRAAGWTDALGRFVTLESYFSDRPNADHWTHLEGDQLGRRVMLRSGEQIKTTAVAEVAERLQHGLLEVAGAPDVDRLLASLKLRRDDDSSSRLLLNPWNFPLSTPAGVTPGLGYLHTIPAASDAAHPPRAAERILRNELLEAIISEQHGGVGSIRLHDRRRPVAAQRLVLSGGGPLQPAECDVRIDRVEMIANTQDVGILRSVGELRDVRGDRVATFQQTTELPARSGVVRICLDIDRSTTSRLYLAHRLAWTNESAQIHRGVQWARLLVEGRDVWSAEYVDIRQNASDSAGVVLLPGGLSRHRLAGPTRLDTPIPSGLERVHLAIGVGSKYATPLMLSESSLPSFWQVGGPGPEVRASWWVSLDAMNLVVSNLGSVDSAGQITLRIMETEGRPAATRLRAWRPFRKAWVTDFRGERLLELEVVDGAVPLDVARYGWLQVEGAW